MAGGWQGEPIGRVRDSKQAHLDSIGAPAVPRVFVIEDEGERPLTMNKVTSMNRFSWAAHTRTVRERWHWLAKAAKVPHLDSVSIVVEPLARTRASLQDAAGCAAEAKAAIDGIVDAGVLDDDSGQFVTSIEFLPMKTDGRNGLRITLKENL
jgi:crossover junction endodeoxyribonuclease RusA